MNVKEKSVLVVGAGSIGGISAAFLKKEGYNVEIVCKYEDYKESIINEGLRVKTPAGSFSEKMKAYASLTDVEEKKDIILFALKATDMKEGANDLKPLLNEDSLLVSMQNGICEPELERILGREHIVGCIVGWGATMDKPGSLVMTSGGDFVIGYTDQDEDERLAVIAELLETIAPVRTSSNMMGQLYSKLIINACITSVGAITGLLLGEMTRNRKARKLFVRIIREALELAYILRIKVEDYAGKLNYYDFIDDKRKMPELRRYLILRLMGLKYRRLKSSSLQSLQRGKLTEIDYLNGYIASNGREYGVPTPVNAAIVNMIHEIEDGKREISIFNLDEQVFKKFY
ncbi:MAG: ketopantoate reductase family protein [Bacteroidales bacterium]|nr:ketopantoate reductase family protein [Bacteroidales bacterium]